METEQQMQERALRLLKNSKYGKFGEYDISITGVDVENRSVDVRLKPKPVEKRINITGVVENESSLTQPHRRYDISVKDVDVENCSVDVCMKQKPAENAINVTDAVESESSLSLLLGLIRGLDGFKTFLFKKSSKKRKLDWILEYLRFNHGGADGNSDFENLCESKYRVQPLDSPTNPEPNSSTVPGFSPGMIHIVKKSEFVDESPERYDVKSGEMVSPHILANNLNFMKAFCERFRVDWDVFNEWPSTCPQLDEILDYGVSCGKLDVVTGTGLYKARFYNGESYGFVRCYVLRE